MLAQFYQAADLYIHAARAETFPNTVSLRQIRFVRNALVATAGRARSQNKCYDGITGFLTPPGDAIAMAENIRVLLEDDSLRLRMGQSGARTCEPVLDLEHQVDQFLEWYSEVIEDWRAWRFRT